MVYKKTSDFQNQVFSITRQKRVRQGKEKLHKEESSSCIFSNLSMSQLRKAEEGQSSMGRRSTQKDVEMDTNRGKK